MRDTNYRNLRLAAPLREAVRDPRLNFHFRALADLSGALD